MQTAMAKPRGNPLTSGLAAGTQNLLSMLGGATAAVGNVTGIETLQQFGTDVMNERAARAAEVGRPDLDIAPWRDEGAAPLPWLGYQVAKQAPTLAALMAAGRFVPKGAIPKSLSTVGPKVPKILGGGDDFARSVTGATIAGYPLGVGSTYQEATEAAGGEAPDKGTALRSLITGVPYAALEAIEPTQLKGFIGKGFAEGGFKGALKSIGKAGVAAGVVEMPQEAAQTALELSFRPDLSSADKTRNIVDAALTGGITAGVLGAGFQGVGGLRDMKYRTPNETTNEEITAVVDGVIAPTEEPAAGPLEPAEAAPQPPTLGQEVFDGLLADAQARSGQPPAYDATARISELLGGNTQINPLAQSLGQAQDEADLIRRVQDEVESRKALPATLKTLGERLGVLDAAGKPRDIAKEIEATDQRIKLAEAEQGADPETIAALRTQKAALEERKPVFDTVVERRAQETRVQEAEAQATKDQLKEAVGGRTTSVLKKYLAMPAGEMIADLQARVNRADGMKGDTSKTVTALAKHFGLLDEDGKPSDKDIRFDLRDVEQKINLGLLNGDKPEDLLELTNQRDSLARRVKILDAAAATPAQPAPKKIAPDLETVEQQLALARQDPETRAGTILKLQKQRDKLAAAVPATPGQTISEEVPPSAQPRVVAEATPRVGRDIQGELETVNQQIALARAQAQTDPEAAAQLPALEMRGRKLLREWRNSGSPARQVELTPTTEPAEVVPEAPVASIEPTARFGAAEEEQYPALVQREAIPAGLPPDIGEVLPPTQPAAQPAPVTPEAPLAEGEISTATVQDVVNEVAPQPVATPRDTRHEEAVRAARARIEQRLNASDRTKLAKHYGHAEYNEETQGAFLGDVMRAIRQGLSSIAKAIRPIVTKVMGVVKEFMADTSGMLGGRRARTASLTALDEAILRTINKKENSEFVRRETGWYKDVDDSWKFEISDQGAKLKDLNGKEIGPGYDARLDDILDHPKLFQAYPTLGKVVFELVDNPNYNGAFFELENKIELSRRAPDHLSTLLHEVQHWVQAKEDFARGTNPDAVDAYAAGNADIAYDFIARVMDEAHTDDIKAMERQLGKAFDRISSDEVDAFARKTDGTPLWHNYRTELDGALRAAKTAMSNMLQVQKFMDAAPMVRHLEAERDAETAEYVKEKVASGERLVREAIYHLSHGEVEARNVQRRRLMTDAQRADIPPMFTTQSDTRGAKTLVRRDDVAAASAASTSIPAMNERAQQGVAFAKTALSKVPIENTKGKFRQIMLYMSTVTNMAEQFKDRMPSVVKYANALRSRAAAEARLTEPQTAALDAFRNLEKRDPKQTKLVGELMTFTASDIDPRKTWEEHTWLHDRDNADEFKQLVAEAHNKWRQVARAKNDAVYNGLLAISEAMRYSEMVTHLENAVNLSSAPNEQIPGFENTALEEYMNTGELHSDPLKARDFWKAQLDQKLADVDAYSAKERGATVDPQRTSDKVQPVEIMARNIRTEAEQMKRAPYFHLGRFGDNYLSMKLRLKDNALDPAAAQEAQKAFDAAGFGDLVAIVPGNRNNTIYVRTENLDQQAAVREVAEDLKRRGFLDNNDKDVIVSGARDVDHTLGQFSGNALDQQLEIIKNSKAFDTTGLTEGQAQQVRSDLNDIVARFRTAWRDTLPNNSLTRVLAPRKNRAGFSADMIRNFAFRGDVSASAVAAMTSHPKVIGALRDAYGEVKAAQGNSTLSEQQKATYSDVYRELLTRESQVPLRPSNTWQDTLSSAAHSYFLMASPAYAATQLSTIPMLLLPELGKRHGFLRSAKAIGRVTPTAFKIMKAVFLEGKAQGNGRWAETTITARALQRSGIPPAVAKFIMGMANRGHLDMGGFTREMGREAANTNQEQTFDKWTRYANSMGVYAETIARVIAALSARELHGSTDGLNEYADSVVEESQMQFGTWNRARIAGKQGFIGAWSPLALKFMGFSFQLMEKLYREFDEAFFDKMATPAARSEARKWLVGHAAMVTALTGSLGLPFAAAAAGVVDALMNLFGADEDKPYNVQEAYRAYLANMFGKGVGEVIARGLPRAVGFDVSNRLGEQNLIPFTKFLTDRRKLEDAISKQMHGFGGAPLSMLSSIGLGTRDLINGDVMSGMKQIVPVGLKNMVEGYTMTTKGYTDKQGNVLPMEAGATDVMWQLLGFGPAEKAEYTEQKLNMTARKQDVAREAGRLRRQLATAVEQGDQAAVRELTAKATAFDAAQGRPMVLGSVGGMIEQRARAKAFSNEANVPIGMSLRDYLAQGNGGYTNWGAGN